MLDLTQNYFSIFNLEPGFEIDVDQLTQGYRNIQNQVHPDRFAGKSDQEQRLAVQYTAFINEAYQCLKQPLERAKYCLKLKGLEINLDAQSHFDGAFLMEQIELREELERISQLTDPAPAIDNLLKQISDKIERLKQRFLLSYSEGDNSQAQDAVVQWQFLLKLQQDVGKLADNVL